MPHDEGTLRYALRRIASLGGDYSDIQLTRPGGPNDSTHRGLLYISSRNVALSALGQRTAAFPEEEHIRILPAQAEHLFCVVAEGRIGGYQKVTQIGDFDKGECQQFAARLNATRFPSHEGGYALTYKVAQYHCLEVTEPE